MARVIGGADANPGNWPWQVNKLRLIRWREGILHLLEKELPAFFHVTTDLLLGNAYRQMTFEISSLRLFYGKREMNTTALFFSLFVGKHTGKTFTTKAALASLASVAILPAAVCTPNSHAGSFLSPFLFSLSFFHVIIFLFEIVNCLSLHFRSLFFLVACSLVEDLLLLLTGLSLLRIALHHLGNYLSD